MLMPILPPRFRIRLRIAVPWVRMWRGRVDNAMMFRGTWVQPRPKPCSSPEMTIGAMPICSENWLICHIDTAVSRRPNRMISRLSTRLISGATRNIATMLPMPRGAVTRPVDSARCVLRVLQHRRQQRRGAVNDQPATKHQQGARDEIGALQQVAVEKRALVGGYRVHGEKIEAEPRDRRLDPDLARMEPVL